MKVTCLIENTTSHEGCLTEHGLSLLIEANGRTVLFDAGSSGNILANAKHLGIDLGTVDTSILSHGHYDHADGFPAFLGLNATTSLYAHKGYNNMHFSARGSYIGVCAGLPRLGRTTVIDSERFDLGDGFELVSYNDCEPIVPIDTAGMKEDDGSGPELERFLHEHYLIVREGSTCLIVTGCTHRGVVNVMEWSKDEGITHLIGGFHLMNVDPADERIKQTATSLAAYPTHYWSCHCTGLPQYARLKELMGSQLDYIASGDTIEF